MKVRIAPASIHCNILQIRNHVLILICLASSLIFPRAYAAELAIQDISGVTRSLTEISEAGQIEFHVLAANGAAAEGAEITLTNTLSGEVLKMASSQGIATFSGVTPGVWTVASTTAGITFTNITVIPTTLAAAGLAGSGTGLALAGGGGLTAGTVATGAGALAAIGGATAIAASELDNSNDENNDLSPFN